MSTLLQQNVKSISAQIFKSEKNRLRKRVIELVDKNKNLGGSPDGFYFQGKFYTNLANGIAGRGTKGNMHISLTTTMTEHARDERKIGYDQGRVEQALSLVLMDCHSIQDMRDALPNCLTDIVQEFSGLSRISKEAFTLEFKPRQYAQYMKIRPLIEFYVSARLLY